MLVLWSEKMSYLRYCHIKILLFLIILLLSFSAFGATDSDNCLGCHDGMKDFTHGGTTCQDCHSDVTSLPHDERLKKPSCKECHRKTAEEHDAGVHGAAKVECKTCHTTHVITKSRKSCSDCHGDASHSSLPSKNKHLEKLSCLSCHSPVKNSSIKTTLQVKRKGLISKASIDLDGNNTIDISEWDNLQAVLSKTFKSSPIIKKSYFAESDVHAIMKKPQPCKACHIDRQLFGQAKLFIQGAVKFEIFVDPSIFIPEIPSIETYRKTVHGQKGVQCSDCHVSQKNIDDCVCIKCHQDIRKVYKDTVHSQKGAIQCIACHNPHRIRAYKELTAKERLAVCSRCHKDYIQTHTWLPNTTLHFKYLECSTCHSPKSAKSMVFYLSTKKGDKEERVDYKTLESFYGKNILMTPFLDKNKDEVVDSQELTGFFRDVRDRLSGNAFIGSSIIVTRVHHDYSVKRQKERICATCHSDQAPFYESMFFVLPEDGFHMYVPVKGTILSAMPISVFVDMSLLGQQKATWADVKGLFTLKPGEFAPYAKELGFKWIDLIAIGLGAIIIFFILVHTLVRIIIRK